MFNEGRREEEEEENGPPNIFLIGRATRTIIRQSDASVNDGEKNASKEKKISRCVCVRFLLLGLIRE